MTSLTLKASLSLVILGLCACSNNHSTKVIEEQVAEQSDPITFMTNQIGFTTAQKKHVVLTNNGFDTFSVLNTDNGDTVLTGTQSKAQSWQPTNDKLFRVIDVSKITAEGNYRIEIEGSTSVYDFVVKQNIYTPLHNAALKSFYYNRASSAITSQFTEQFSRALGHPDMVVKVHSSASSDNLPAGSTIAAAKGWYDAGDYGKYVVNSGIATYTMLSAFSHHKAFYLQQSTNIPESNDDIPDILNEVKWNLDWLATMQAPDGGIFHKLTTKQWPGIEMPEDDTRERFVIGKSTAASLNFAATMSAASRIFSENLNSDIEYQSWLSAAERAWQWAVANPNVIYQQPDDIKSGEYGDSELKDEFSWAAIELYLATKKTKYLQAFDKYSGSLTNPSWQNVSSLPYIAIVNSKDDVPDAVFQHTKTQLLSLANTYLEHYENSVFKVSMTTPDFVWGSNSVALNKAWILAEAFKLSQDNKFKVAALGSINYLLGQNPLAFSFITGFGAQSVKHPHHRVSEADNVLLPVPGMLAGGPQPGKQDECDYLHDSPAETYIDDWCSYATNEVAINWNAPLVYMLSFKLTYD